MADGFLGRWSRRKVDAREGKPLEEPAAVPQAKATPVTSQVVAPASQDRADGLEPVALPPEAPPPTLEDAGRLTPESDFKPFVARGVSPDVKNAAMKKLFTDPHYNVMDGLDIYIDDYSLPDPLPKSMIRQMASAQFLDLFDEQKNARAKALREAADSPGDHSVAESQAISQEPTDKPSTAPAPDPSAGPESEPPRGQTPDASDHANSDLRLQQDHAAGAEDPRRRTE